jgi:hypothetical protein
MRRASSAFMVLLLFSQTGISLAQDAIDLIDKGYQWKPTSSQTRISFKKSGLEFISNIPFSGIYNLRPIGASPGDQKLLRIELKTSVAGRVELFWAARGKQFSPLKNYPFYIKKAGKFHSYYINISDYNRDRKNIDYVLLSFNPGPGRAEIKAFKLIPGSLWEKTIAGWQELFGPLGREPDGFNFLVIRSPRLFGSPFLFYVNWLLGVLLVFVILLRSRIDLRRSFFIALLSLWGLLEFNYLFSNWISFRKDLPFWGKSLEEKRSMVNSGDFYSFAKFAEKELPAGSAFDIRASGLNNKTRAIYYLYPRECTTEAAYLLVYDRKLGDLSPHKYRLWKEFRPGAYIYKCI